MENTKRNQDLKDTAKKLEHDVDQAVGWVQELQRLADDHEDLALVSAGRVDRLASLLSEAHFLLVGSSKCRSRRPAP